MVAVAGRPGAGVEAAAPGRRARAVRDPRPTSWASGPRRSACSRATRSSAVKSQLDDRRGARSFTRCREVDGADRSPHHRLEAVGQARQAARQGVPGRPQPSGGRSPSIPAGRCASRWRARRGSTGRSTPPSCWPIVCLKTGDEQVERLWLRRPAQAASREWSPGAGRFRDACRAPLGRGSTTETEETNYTLGLTQLGAVLGASVRWASWCSPRVRRRHQRRADGREARPPAAPPLGCCSSRLRDEELESDIARAEPISTPGGGRPRGHRPRARCVGATW